MNEIKDFFNNTKVGKWLKKTAIKTVKTMAEAAIGIIGTNSFGITDVDWTGVASAAALAGIVTILFNIKSIKVEE